MYTANMSCKTSVAILEIGTGKEDKQPRLNQSRDIDLSLKHKYLLLPYCHVHLSCGMIACHGVAESSESDDIKLSNFEAETTLDSKQCWFVYETRLSPTDKQDDSNEVLDLVSRYRILFEESGREKQLQQRKVIGRKQRKRGSMKSKGCYIYRENTSIGKEFIDGKDAEQVTKELSLNICFKGNKFSHFDLCYSKKLNEQFEIAFHSKTDDDLTDDTEIEKASFSEAFKNVLRDELSEENFVVPKNVLHYRMFGDRLVNEGEVLIENVLHKGVSGDCSVEFDWNVLHKDVSGDCSVEFDWNVLHKVVFGELSIQVKNVPPNDGSGDSSIEVDWNVLHKDVSVDSSIEVAWNVLHKDESVDSSIEVDWNVPQKDVSGDSSIQVKNVLHKDVSVDSSIEVAWNVIHKDESVDISIEVDWNVPQKDVSGDSSIQVKNVLHKDVSGDSSIQVDKNVPFNDMCGDSPVFENMPHNLSVNSAVTIENKANNYGDGSIKICGNYLFKDLPENIWLEICQNVLPIGISESKCVDIVLHSSPADKISGNNLHTDLFDSSESVKISGNNLQNDLFQDSFESLKINLHNDLFEGSLEEPVKVIGNNLHTDLFEDSLESIKINENNHHNNLFEDSEESVKTSKNMVSDAVFEDSTFIVSKRFHNMKFNVSNTNDTKATDSADWMFNSSGSDDIKSKMDFLQLLGINPKCSQSLPMFWQEITLYPFTHVNNPPGDLHQLMCYEVFRLCSFSYARFPADFDVWVTRLAQAGFYCENESGRMVCFHCGCEFHGTVGSSIADVHHPECQRLEHSRPLHVWTEGLNQEILTVYYNRYGSLRPYNFEMTNQQNLSDDADSAHRSIQGSAVSQPQAQSEQASGEQASGGMSEGRELGVSVLAEVTREDSTIEEAARPEYHSVTLPADLGETAHDHGGFGDQQQSLPGNLNEVSGAIVSEESQDTPRSYQILTSAAKKPMEFNSAAARGSHSQAEHSNDNGAVGGVGVTFDLSKASYPLFSSAEARRQTFTSWSRTHSHQPEDLATAGFFYAGYADCVRCFFCGLGLKYWRPNDIPAYLHAMYRPHCVYNRMYKGQDYFDRVQQDLRSEQGTAYLDVETGPPAQGEAMRAVVARQAKVVSVGRGVDVTDTIHGGADEPSQTTEVPVQQPAVPPIEFNVLFRLVEREHTLLAERTTCRLCISRPVSCIYLPCGHVIICHECGLSHNVTHCIICSKKVFCIRKIYLA